MKGLTFLMLFKVSAVRKIFSAIMEGRGMIGLSEKNSELLKRLKKYSPDTYYHSVRVKYLVMRMLDVINSETGDVFSPDARELILKGALLHDIGKLYIKNSLLTKKDRFTEGERHDMESHARLGYEAVLYNGEEDKHGIIPNICRYHHERIDGSGTEKISVIPFYVQIVSAADVFDALRSDRIYKRAIEKDKALKMIENGECGAFSKEITDYLEKVAAILK